jgi:hypothetical protein
MVKSGTDSRANWAAREEEPRLPQSYELMPGAILKAGGGDMVVEVGEGGSEVGVSISEVDGEMGDGSGEAWDWRRREWSVEIKR